MDFYFTFIFLSFLPSILWLTFFLQEDKRPEPGKMIVKIFFYGMVATIPVILISLLIYFFLAQTNISEFAMKIIMVVLITSFTEETAKYLIVKKSVLKSPECDEPIDIMIYAITAALGFAALENIFFLFPLGEAFYYKEMILGSFFRFMSGTFLHALTSGIMGYFLAISILRKKRRFFSLLGLFLAIALHAFYNFFVIISSLHEFFLILVPATLIILFIIVFLCFRKLKKTPSICK